MSSPTFFGHPRGLATLFFTEMWERFTFYGMRSLLVLFMTAAVVGGNPGLGLTEGEANAIYGLYLSCVYLFALPGGWIADRLGARRGLRAADARPGGLVQRAVLHLHLRLEPGDGGTAAGLHAGGAFGAAVAA